MRSWLSCDSVMLSSLCQPLEGTPKRLTGGLGALGARGTAKPTAMPTLPAHKPPERRRMAALWRSLWATAQAFSRVRISGARTC